MPEYRGDLHVHTARSNGADLTPADVVREARAAGLDFIATTEHDTVDGHADWAPFADTLLVIPGQEVVTRTGHWLSVGSGLLVDSRYGIRDGRIADELARVRADGGICVAAHPHAPYPSGQLAYPFELFDAVEVWNGPWTSDVPWQADNHAAVAEWSRSLAAGRWRPAVGNSDAHLAGQLGTPVTVVRAAACTAADIVAAVRAGRCWIAATADVSLEFTASTGAAVAGPGELLVAGEHPVTVSASVGGVPDALIRVHTERGVAVEQRTAELSTTVTDPGFVWVSVRSGDGAMAAMTNPVLLAGQSPAQPSPSPSRSSAGR
ncbi:CehA/McbA family metallohydrolase [Pseudonocardia sp. CA-107938]|uniref:CehA/McbA family metallohydrolase n=1 Tax=Pseudonocardia sp. CA-107938 TaxID=3240021 RepID=UPI003D90B385